MSVLNEVPNRNFLSPLNFNFSIQRSPNVNFYLQKVNIPDIYSREINAGNPFVKVPLPGDHLDFGVLSITYKVDDDLKNFMELQNWLRGLGKPESWDQNAALTANPIYSGNGIYSDISLVILNATKIPNYEVVFTDAFPISMTSMIFDTTNEDVNFMTASANFKYSYYTVNKIV